MIRAGIIGGAGYTAGELLRILLNHPEAEIAFVQSSSNAGNPLWAVHSGLFGDTDLHFCADAPLDAEKLRQAVDATGYTFVSVSEEAAEKKGLFSGLFHK